VVVVPRDTVDGHVMRLVRVEERARVRLATDVQLALLRTHQVQVVLVHVEVKRRTTTSTTITDTIAHHSVPCYEHDVWIMCNHATVSETLTENHTTKDVRYTQSKVHAEISMSTKHV